MRPIQTTYRRSTRPSPSAPASGYPGQGEGGSNAAGFATQLDSATPELSLPPSLPPSVSPSPPLPLAPSQILPRYDINARILTVAGHVIVHLPAQARNLIAALAAIELAGWPPRIASPLRADPTGNDRHNLAMAVYKLNARQTLIDFHTDDGALRWNWRPAARRKMTEH